MNKSLLLLLMLPVYCGAQKLEFRHANGITYNKNKFHYELPDLSLRLAYNINHRWQVGLNGVLGADGCSYAEIFANITLPITINDHQPFYAGLNAGPIYYKYSKYYNSDYWIGKGYKGGMQLGFIAPASTDISAFLEGGISIASVAETRSHKYGMAGPVFETKPERMLSIFIPMMVGVRYYFTQ